MTVFFICSLSSFPGACESGCLVTTLSVFTLTMPFIFACICNNHTIAAPVLSLSMASKDIVLVMPCKRSVKSTISDNFQSTLILKNYENLLIL